LILNKGKAPSPRVQQFIALLKQDQANR
jgi:hypothetical protein